jgi:hypothetical protein
MAKMRFRLEGGQHREGKAVYKHGDIIETDKPLDVIFKRTRKFIKLSDSPLSAGASGKGSSLSELFGSDVTSIAHAKLLSEKIAVFQKGGWFNVVNVDTKKAINPKALRGVEVEGFIEDYLKEKAEAEAEGGDTPEPEPESEAKPAEETVKTVEDDEVSAAIAEAIKEDEEE